MTRWLGFVCTLLTLLAVPWRVSAQAPVVTIDANKNFCINGQPTFLLGTIGGNAQAWQTYLAPAGFNIRFLGDTAAPGASAVGGWELPDVLSDPASVAGMASDPGYLMWDLAYEVDSALSHPTQWLGHTLYDVNAVKAAVRAADNPANPRPIGFCWGNAHRYLGSEFWGRDGYWHSYRHWSQLPDYFVGGDYNWIEEQTVSHAVRMTQKPVIFINHFWPIVDWSGVPTWCHVEQMHQRLWWAVICGARGIILDRYEIYDAQGQYYNWVDSLDMIYWQTISKAISEIRSLEQVLLAPGDWMYYKQSAIEEPTARQIMYTFRSYAGDMYLIAVNESPWVSRSAEIYMSTPTLNPEGEVLFDYYASGAVMAPPTNTTIVDTSKNWAANELAGHRLWIRHSSPAHDHYYPILSNTNNTITVASGNLLSDGVARADFYKVIQLVHGVNRRFTINLAPGGRRVVKFPGTTWYPFARKIPAPNLVSSNRRWIKLADWSDSMDDYYPIDAYGLCYDQSRGRLVAQGGLNGWVGEKPNPTDPDVASNNFVWEWDIDTGYYSGPLRPGMQQGGDPWPGGTSYHDMVYDPVRQACVLLNDDMQICEWRGIEQGWTVKDVEIPNYMFGDITHYAACFDTEHSRFLLYGGKDWMEYGSQGRGMQFTYEWRNLLLGFDGTQWLNFNNPDANLTITAVEEPVMCWNYQRNAGLLFGLNHDGRFSKDSDPQKFLQESPQQTYSISVGSNAVRYTTQHVPPVYANYQMVFDPRTGTVLLFGGLPSVNGRNTDLYEFDYSDWKRLNYSAATLPAQDVMRIPALTYDPEHSMVIFLDTRDGAIWGLTDGTETYSTSIPSALDLAAGARVCLEGCVVSRRYDGFFYMQDTGRTSAIRVISDSTAVAPGKLVNVLGTVSVLANGEKAINAQVVGVAGQADARPLAMVGRTAGGRSETGVPGVGGGIGTNNVGLLVRLCGAITYSDSEVMYIDDGSGLADGSGHAGVRVRLHGVDAPDGGYVAVTGALTVETINAKAAPVVLLAGSDDLREF